MNSVTKERLGVESSFVFFHFPHMLEFCKIKSAKLKPKSQLAFFPLRPLTENICDAAVVVRIYTS